MDKNFEPGDKVKIKVVESYLTDHNCNIPPDLMIHGNATLSRTDPRAWVVTYLDLDGEDERIFIVNFMNRDELEMQLGYRAKDLDLVEKKQITNSYPIF